MSETSQQLLKTSHKGVHEQFDMLVAAMHTQTLLQSDMFFRQVQGKSSRQINAWIKKRTVMRMREMDYSPGFFQKRLLVYVFELYERFYEQYRSLLRFKEDTPLQEVQYLILILAAAFLDEQFTKEGLADICTFLKQSAEGGTL